MKFLVYFCMFIAIPAFATPAQDALIERLSSYQRLTAAFTHQLVGDGEDVIQQQKGTLAVQRPWKFRWDMQDGNEEQLIIANGTMVWLYDKALAQVTKQRFDQQNTSSPAALLGGDLAQIKKNYRVTQLKKTPGIWFKLVPTSKQPAFQWAELQFSPQLKTLVVSDNLGQLSRYEFSQVRVNPILSPQVFQFTVPKGVDVIEN